MTSTDTALDRNSTDSNRCSDWYLTPTHLLEYLYCPRFTYYEYVLAIPEFQEKRFKVQRGREVHDERMRVNPKYLRKTLGVTRRDLDVDLHSDTHHIKGKVDELLWLDDGTMAPFDYKYAQWKGRVYVNQKVQAALYGLMITDVYGLPVRRGFLCYTRSKHKVVEIVLDDAAYERALKALQACLKVIREGVYPAATDSSARCPDCCYRNLCLM